MVMSGVKDIQRAPVLNGQEGNADPALKPDFHIFLLIFQHK